MKRINLPLVFMIFSTIEVQRVQAIEVQRVQATEVQRVQATEVQRVQATEGQRVQTADKEAVVIDVRKNVALSKNDKVHKNFYINAGANRGLKKGSIVDVLRRVPLHDPLRNVSVGDLKIKVAELEIIFGDEYLSIARLSKYADPEESPLLDFVAVMVGDRLDLSSIKNPPAPAAPVATEPLENVALLNRENKAKLHE